MTAGAPRDDSVMLHAYSVVRACPEHLAALPAIERAASGMFPPALFPQNLRGQVVPIATLNDAQADGRLWIGLSADRRPVGFALVQRAGKAVWLVEVDVHPDHARKGLGRALVRTVVEWARSEGFAAVTLTTFAELPWNAPFYERLGFRKLSSPDLTPDLCRILRQEMQAGLRDRVAMQLDLC